MTGDETYIAAQAGWGILWTVLALVGLGGIYNAAKAAGLLPENTPRYSWNSGELFTV
ncbi:MAG: hypothetical protein SPK00_02740 [Corynebacterium glucuronolyticum]|nr:hypothetical protein [Mycobacteriaceae bacterium]MDY5833656.1 hypothetical protein [Corynebacterium glucuronolyticum]